MTPEGRVKAVVKQRLREHNAYWLMPTQNGMGAPALDFIGCSKGRFFAIETKAGGACMTPRQSETAEKMRAACGRVFLVNELDGLAALTDWLQE